MADEAKAAAARAAAELVRDGMLVGLGTGSTATLFVQELGRRVRAGRLRIRGVATSRTTAQLAAGFGIPLLDESDCPALDLAVDGADEIDPHGRLVKGRGGALFREKIVAAAARRFVVVADAGKLVARLGSTGPVPVEVVPFAWEAHRRFLERWGRAEIRVAGGVPFVTDNGNRIVDVRFAEPLADPDAVAAAWDARTGIVEHGLFLAHATSALVGDGASVRPLEFELRGGSAAPAR